MNTQMNDKAKSMNSFSKLSCFDVAFYEATLSNLKVFYQALFALCLCLICSVSNAVEMTGLDVEKESEGKLKIIFSFNGEPPQPTAYNIERPARIALDLPGVTSALEQKKFPLAYGNVESLVVLEASGRTRVVINLAELAVYKTTVDGNTMNVVIGGREVENTFIATQDAIGSNQSSSASSSKLGISYIDFQRGDSGEGNVVIELTDDKADVDVRLDSRKIVLKFAQTTVASNFLRRFDVTDFATPVKNFEVNQSGNDTLVEILPTGEYDYLAYQTDNIYVLSVRPLSLEEVEEKRKEFAFSGEKLSLSFQDIKVRSVLQLIADFTELNLVTSDTVRGNITLRLEDVPWDQALDLILKTKGLDKRQSGNVLMIAPAAEIAERERLELETNKQLDELAPLQTEFIRIRYANAGELYNLFQSGGSSSGGADFDLDTAGSLSGEQATGATGAILSPRGSVVVDERTNTLLITDTADRIADVKRLIAKIDVPLRQVLVEARIVIANDTFDEEIGVQWGGGTADETGSDRFGIVGSLDSLLNESGADLDERTSIFDFVQGNGSIEFPDANFIDLGISETIGLPQSIALGYLSDNAFLAAELSAVAAEGKGEVVSQPKLITGDKQEAEIKTGEEIPYVESSANGRSTVKFREAVLSLKVTPSITPDNRLIMDINIKQDSRSEDLVFGENSSRFPILNKNELRTQALVDNGKTIVLGGVFRESELMQETKVPLLGDLPFIGRAFKRTLKGHEKNELLIFITPRILTDRVLD